MSIPVIEHWGSAHRGVRGGGAAVKISHSLPPPLRHIAALWGGLEGGGGGGASVGAAKTRGVFMEVSAQRKQKKIKDVESNKCFIF